MNYFVIQHATSENYLKVIHAEDGPDYEWTEPWESYEDATAFESPTDVLRFVLQAASQSKVFSWVANWQVIEVTETASFTVIA